MDGWGDEYTVYPARSLRIDAEAAGETNTQHLDSLGRVDSVIDDIVNLRLESRERPLTIGPLPPEPADFLAAIDGWIDVVQEPIDIIMRRSLEPPVSHPVSVRYQSAASEDPWVRSPPRSPRQAAAREDPGAESMAQYVAAAVVAQLEGPDCQHT